MGKESNSDTSQGKFVLFGKEEELLMASGVDTAQELAKIKQDTNERLGLVPSRYFGLWESERQAERQEGKQASRLEGRKAQYRQILNTRTLALLLLQESRLSLSLPLLNSRFTPRHLNHPPTPDASAPSTLFVPRPPPRSLHV